MPLAEVDDLVEALLVMTRPEQPILHYWRTNPEAADLAGQAIAQLHVSVAEAVALAIEAEIANHLDTDTPVVIEGDDLLPSLAAPSELPGMPGGASRLSRIPRGA